MTGARTRLLESLRGSIARMESPEPSLGDEHAGARRVALGHAEADAALQGGLALGAVHEVYAQAGRQSAAATGFIAGLAQRVSLQRPLLWVRQDFGAREYGALSMSGWRELGLDPRMVVSVCAADVDSALRTTADALACDALGAVVLEIWGEPKQFDLVASRKLTLAARASGVTGLMLRVAAEPSPSTAETRWIVRSVHSPPLAASEPWRGWGSPVLEAQLVRNRRGPNGQWIMEWKCDECVFRDAAPDTQPVAAAPADRPYQTAAIARHGFAARTGEQRRAG